MWFKLGGFTSRQEGFNEFFSRMSRALTSVLDDAGGGDLAQCVHSTYSVLRSPQCMREFKFSGRPMKHHRRLSPSNVFPLPPMSKGSKLLSWPSKGALDDECIFYGGNLVVAALNWMHGGWSTPPEVLTAAHQRVHARLASTLSAVVMTDEPILSPVGLDAFTRHTQLYSGCGVVLALGVRGGVPDKAADVKLADHLEPLFPELSQQVRMPTKLLMRAGDRPKRLKKVYTWVSSTYPSLVRKNVKAGLHKLRRVKEVAKHNGKLVLAGAFAVVKDQHEDRVITDPQINQLLDPSLLPRPKFAYVPSLRSTFVPAHGKIVVSKRDARHYFHRLQIGHRWAKYLCGPPITHQAGDSHGGLLYPACRSTPMGFGPSAGWAQGLTDVVTHVAGLPADQRVHPDFVVPSSLPLWGSIIDDIWALDHQDTPEQSVVGPEWLDRAEAAWCVRGVEPNSKKTINGHEGEEIQGYFVHPSEHWIGVAMEKRRYLVQSTFMLLMKEKVVVAVVDRLIGKHSFIHSARPCLRSIFEVTYSWINSQRHSRRGLVQLPPEVWCELLVSTLLIGFAQFNLSSPWSNRIECSDASMTGLGRSYGYIPSSVAQVLARYSDHRSVYTNLSLPWGVGLDGNHACPLRKVRIPVKRIKWSHISTPWSCSHITLGEADAAAWVAEDRLRRAVDDGARFVHPLDSAATVGGLTKGRSSSHALNERCRRVASCTLAGGHEVFYPWVPSKENPADEPSRRYEPTASPQVG